MRQSRSRLHGRVFLKWEDIPGAKNLGKRWVLRDEMDKLEGCLGSVSLGLDVAESRHT